MIRKRRRGWEISGKVGVTFPSPFGIVVVKGGFLTSVYSPLSHFLDIFSSEIGSPKERKFILTTRSSDWWPKRKKERRRKQGVFRMGTRLEGEACCYKATKLKVITMDRWNKYINILISRKCQEKRWGKSREGKQWEGLKKRWVVQAQQEDSRLTQNTVFYSNTSRSLFPSLK